MKQTRPKVLLLEDFAPDARSIQTALKTSESRYVICWAERLEEALQQLDCERFDVILSDLSLPDSTGAATIDAVSQKSRGAAVIVLTSLAEEEFALQLLDRGVQDYLVKDEIDPKTLNRALRYAIQRQHNRAQIEQLLAKEEECTALLERKNRRLARLYETAQRFVDNVSHEFRTPLTVVKEYTSLLREGLLGEVNDEQCRYLDVVADRADDLNRMVDDMLDVSKLEAGMLGVWRRNCEVADIVSHIEPGLSKKAELKNVDLRIEIPDDLPTVYCDDEKAGRVLVNLTVNAIKFCGEPGLVRLRAGVHEKGRSVVIAVTDNGPGIDAAGRKKIFRRFKQVEQQSRGSTKGFGLVLNIARELVDLNLGQMSIDSEPGEGTTFRFTLPLADPAIVMRRYLRKLSKRRRSASRWLSLIRCEIDDPGYENAGHDVDALLNYVLRRNDLLLRLPDAPHWLLVVPEPAGQLHRIHRRIEQHRRDANRNRPRGPLPEIRIVDVGSWSLPVEVDEVHRKFSHILQSEVNHSHVPA